MTVLHVLTTGPLALVQDLGRAGFADLGVSRSGAADRRAHRLANRLVANPEDWATWRSPWAVSARGCRAARSK